MLQFIGITLASIVLGSAGAPPPTESMPERIEAEQDLMTTIRAETLQEQQERQRSITITQAAEPEPAPPPPAPPVQSGGTVWDRLAECESHGDWGYNEHSGWGSGIYDGGLQFLPKTWTDFGGGQYAPTADQATREQQIAIAEKVLAAQGWKAWPACSLKLGLR